MIKILRWFLGYSSFKIEGNVDLFISKFYNVLWLVNKNDGYFYAQCLTKNFNFILNNATDYECVITKIKDYGFLNLLKKYLIRKGLFVGLTFFLICLFLSNFFVWDVKVRGNNTIPDEKIFRICDKCGLHTGALIFNVDDDNLEFKLKKEFEIISWVSVNKSAGKYLIEIKEGDLKPNLIQDKETPCNVVAAFDGLVLSVTPFSGFLKVQAGDYVKQNQLLVSAVDEYKPSQKMLYAHSDAEIIAKVERLNEIRLPKISIRNQSTGLYQEENRLKLFGLKIPIESTKISKNAVIIDKQCEPIEFLSFRLPIMCEKITYDIVSQIEIKNDPEQLKRMLMKQQRQWEVKELQDTKILNRNYSFEETTDEVILKSTILVCQRIDKKQPVFVNNNDETIEELNLN